MAEWRYSDVALDAISEELVGKSDYFLGWTQQMTSTVITQYYATDNLDEARAAFDRIWSPEFENKKNWWARIVIQMRCGAFDIDGVSCDSDDELPW